MHVCIVYRWLLTLPCTAVGMCACSECVGAGMLCVGACMCVCVVWRLWRAAAKSQQQPRADSSPQRFRARCQGSQGNVCGYIHVRTTHQHTMSSDLKGHLLWSGSVAASAQSSSKVSPRQPRCIIPFHLIPSTNCVLRDWPVSPGARGDGSGAVCLLSVSAMTLSAWAGSE